MVGLRDKVLRLGWQGRILGVLGILLCLILVMLVADQRSGALAALFFLIIVIVALHWPLEITLLNVGIMSGLTYVVLNQGGQPDFLAEWGVDSLVYLLLGVTVNLEVDARRQEHRFSEEIDALSDVSSSLTRTLDLHELTDQVADHVFSLFDPEGCTIYLLEPGKKELKPVAARERHHDSFILEQIMNSSPRVGIGMVGWVAATGESVLSGDAEQDIRAIHISGTPIDDESVIGVPLKADGEVFGVLWIYKLGLDAYSEEDLRLATIFANQVSVALANARLYEHVRNLSETDGLTGLLNSRCLTSRTEGMLAQAVIRKEPASLLFLDCDDFKGINDRFGHMAGDKFLRDFAKTLKDGVRENDIVIRYAGDEFVVLLPNADLNLGTKVASRLLESFHEARQREEFDVFTTVSVGLATFPEHARSAEELIKCADHALYVAKGQGKDQLAVYQVGKSEQRGARRS